MNQKIKLATAFLCGSIFFGGISYAATGDVTGKLSNLKILVNGSEKQLNNKPVVINNTTYLPIRDVGTATGYSVSYESGVVSLTSTTQNNTSTETSGSSSEETTNSSMPSYTLQVLPISVTHDNVSVTINSVTLGDYSTDFDVTIVNDSSKDLQVRRKDSGLGVNYKVSGKTFENYANISDPSEFDKLVPANSTVTGTIKKQKVPTDTENLLLHLNVNGTGFSFYIDTKGIF